MDSKGLDLTIETRKGRNEIAERIYPPFRWSWTCSACGKRCKSYDNHHVSYPAPGEWNAEVLTCVHCDHLEGVVVRLDISMTIKSGSGTVSAGTCEPTEDK